MTEKKRLDVALVERGLVETRQRAQALIMAGKVLVDDTPRDKPGVNVLDSSVIKLKEADFPYASRGALKLKEAIEHLELDVTGFVCLDAGASTGGFTDCLLQYGAAKVFAVDVGYGQLAWKLRQDERVIVHERTNIRHLEKETIGEDVDLVVIDTSFISLKIVVPAILKFLKPGGQILALIKPQFEVGKGKVGKGGVVRDPALHQEVIDNLTQFFSDAGLVREELIVSPITGPKGNKEFIISLRKGLSDSKISDL